MRLCVQGHCKGEAWGLAMHPIEAQYITSGDDNTARLWDTASHSMVTLYELPEKARALCYNTVSSQRIA